MMLRGEEARAFIVEQRRQRKAQGGKLSSTELTLWKVAMQAPFGLIVIGRQGDPYLIRVYLLPERPLSVEHPGLYLHYFVRGDSDPNPHNHPWSSARSQILTGGYTEFRYDPKTDQHTSQVCVPGSINELTHETYHRVELLEPNKGCWTLFTAGTRLRASTGEDWGFFDLSTKRHIDWGHYSG